MQLKLDNILFNMYFAGFTDEELIKRRQNASNKKQGVFDKKVNI